MADYIQISGDVASAYAASVDDNTSERGNASVYDLPIPLIKRLRKVAARKGDRALMFTCNRAIEFGDETGAAVCAHYIIKLELK